MRQIVGILLINWVLVVSPGLCVTGYLERLCDCADCCESCPSQSCPQGYPCQADPCDAVATVQRLSEPDHELGPAAPLDVFTMPAPHCSLLLTEGCGLHAPLAAGWLRLEPFPARSLPLLL